MGIYSHFSAEQRVLSYDYIETFISESVTDWDAWNKDVTTDDVEQQFSSSIRSMNNIEFEFLLIHCGYIPDYYGKDSAQETLYSKLVESVVCEWGKRIGFADSVLQKQKANKEDVTIIKEGNIIVCDAKSFRLGRSQAAPNVKDTIKKEAYTKWLSDYPEDSRVGGLTTFPSLHNWKKGSAAYHYYTEGSPSIMILFYEQMAYILHYGIDADAIITFLKSYDTIFPSPSDIQSVYWEGLTSHLFSDVDSYYKYLEEARSIIIEKVQHTLAIIQGKISSVESEVDDMLSKMTPEEIKKKARSALIENRCKELQEQVNHIIEFRPTSL